MDEKGNMTKKTTRKIDKIIIHCSASKEGQSLTVEQIDKMHRKRGFAQNPIFVKMFRKLYEQ